MHHDFGFGVLFETGFKHVERTVVSVVEGVFNVLFEGHFEFASIVSLATLKQARPKSFQQLADAPRLMRRPGICDASEDAGTGAFFILFNELLGGDLVDVDAVDVLNGWFYANLILGSPVFVAGPIFQEKICAVFGLHVAHFLPHSIAHPASLQVLGQALYLGECNCVVVNFLFDWQKWENFADCLLFGGALEVALLLDVLATFEFQIGVDKRGLVFGFMFFHEFGLPLGRVSSRCAVERLVELRVGMGLVDGWLEGVRFFRVAALHAKLN